MGLPNCISPVMPISTSFLCGEKLLVAWPGWCWCAPGKGTQTLWCCLHD